MMIDEGTYYWLSQSLACFLFVISIQSAVAIVFVGYFVHSTALY